MEEARRGKGLETTGGEANTNESSKTSTRVEIKKKESYAEKMLNKLADRIVEAFDMPQSFGD